MNVEDRVREVLRAKANVTPAPDALDRILSASDFTPQRGAPFRRGARRSDLSIEPRNRVAAGIVAFVVAVAAIGLVTVAFKGKRAAHSPVSPPTTTAAVHSNGDIWAAIGGGEGGVATSRVDPMSGHTTIMWTDGRWPGSTGTSSGKVNQAAIGDGYSFSPDGSKVVFSAYGYDPGGKVYGTELFTMDADGTNVQQLTHDHAVDGYPAWSPDGRSIIYASYRGPDFVPGCLGLSSCLPDLYVIGASGGTPTQLTNDVVGETQPSWSPDGSKVTFVSVGSDGTGSIETMNADGSGRKTIASGAGAFFSYPRWSPAGDLIAFLRADKDQTYHLWTVGPDGSDPRDLLDTGADSDYGPIVWSPDATEIAFPKVIAGEPQVWLADPTGSRRQLATWPHYGISPLAWRPGAPVQAESGVSFAPSAGWSTSTYRGMAWGGSNPGPTGGAWAANVAFDRGDLPERTGLPLLTLRSLPPTGVVLTVETLGSNRPDSLSLPLDLTGFNVRAPQAEEPPGLTVYEAHGVVNGQDVLVRVYFGAQHPTSGDLQGAQGELNGLEIPSSSASSGPSTSPVTNPATASSTLPEGVLTFISGAHANRVFTIDAGAHRLRELAGGAGRGVSLSSLGQVAFSAPTGSRSAQIRIHNLDGSLGAYYVPSIGIDEYPAWSPRATSLAFSDGKEIEVWNQATQHITPVTAPPRNCSDHMSAWSPDGTKLVFWRTCDVVQGSGFYETSATGGPVTPITLGSQGTGADTWPGTNIRGVPTGVSWSSQGSIAFQMDDGSVWLAGSAPRMLVGPDSVPASDAFGTISWSHSSRELAFVRGGGIDIINPSGGRVVSVAGTIGQNPVGISWGM